MCVFNNSIVAKIVSYPNIVNGKLIQTMHVDGGDIDIAFEDHLEFGGPADAIVAIGEWKVKLIGADDVQDGKVISHLTCQDGEFEFEVEIIWDDFNGEAFPVEIRY